MPNAWNETDDTGSNISVEHSGFWPIGEGIGIRQGQVEVEWIIETNVELILGEMSLCFSSYDILDWFEIVTGINEWRVICLWKEDYRLLPHHAIDDRKVCQSMFVIGMVLHKRYRWCDNEGTPTEA